MPIDSSIPLLGRPMQFDPMQAYGQAATLAQLAQLGQLRAEQLRGEKMQNDEMAAGIQRGQQIRDVLAEEPDLEKALPRIFGIDPKTGMTLDKHLVERAKARIDNETAEAKLHSDRLDLLAKIMYPSKDQQTYINNLKRAASMKAIDPQLAQQILEQHATFDPKFVDELVRQSLSGKEALDMHLAELKDNREKILHAYAVEEAKGKIEGQELDNDARMQKVTGQEPIQPVDAMRDATTRRGQDMGVTTGTINLKNTQANQQVNNESKLRDDYTNASKNYVTVKDAMGRVLAAAKGNNGASSLALIFGYMKILDPNSTVREGEQATAANVGTVPQKIAQLYNRLLESGESLPPEVKKQFVDEAYKAYDVAYQNHSRVVKQYTDISRNSGARPGNVVIDYGREYRLYANKNGHRIGSPDGKTWFDVETGQQVQ